MRIAQRLDYHLFVRNN